MKHLRRLLCMACFILIQYFCFSQSFVSNTSIPPERIKAELFSSLLPKSYCSVDELNIIFLKKDSTISLTIGSNRVHAALQARIKTVGGLERINAKLAEYPGFMISISRIPLSDGTFIYHGMLLNPDFPETLLICRQGSDYCFLKTESRLLKAE
jgi:hypothetical protein